MNTLYCFECNRRTVHRLSDAHPVLVCQECGTEECKFLLEQIDRLSMQIANRRTESALYRAERRRAAKYTL
jgi:hypothetical protein